MRFLFSTFFLFLLWAANFRVNANELPAGLVVFAPADKFPEESKLTKELLLKHPEWVLFSNGKILSSFVLLRFGVDKIQEQTVELAKIEKCDKALFYCDSVNQRMFEVTPVSEGPVRSIYNFRHVDDRNLTVVMYRAVFLRDLDLLLPVYYALRPPLQIADLGYPNTYGLTEKQYLTMSVKSVGGLVYPAPSLGSDILGRVNIGDTVKIIAWAEDAASKILWVYIVSDKLQGYTFSGLFESTQLRNLPKNIVKK